MKKANIFRSIFWGLIMLILLSLGIVGVLHNINSYKEKEKDLERIVTLFNNNSTIKDYEKVDTKIKASIEGKNIIIDCKTVTDKEYIFTFKRSYLETNIAKDDTLGRVIIMVLSDSISVNKGNFEGDTYDMFTNNIVDDYKLKDGIEFNDKNDRQTVKISLETSVKKS